MKVIIRELRPEDASVSWKWRNDPEVWALTGREWDNLVSEEIERIWIEQVIKNEKDKRFAICIGDEKEYVGNVQLTNITSVDGCFHIFIGEKSYWGKGVATTATKLLLKYAKDFLKIKQVYLTVKKKNVSAIKVYEKNGFFISDVFDNEYKMLCVL
ncbi:GNAT family N-acetyltransferase [Bacteroidales bacterium OttesenSCG-928-I21]|nr:GNAT family N-acetyltransferase [Bacteroidales bacterium OttesenSCG-928-I21]